MPHHRHHCPTRRTTVILSALTRSVTAASCSQRLFRRSAHGPDDRTALLAVLALVSLLGAAGRPTPRPRAASPANSTLPAVASWSPSFCETPAGRASRNSAAARAPSRSWCTACGRNTSAAFQIVPGAAAASIADGGRNARSHAVAQTRQPRVGQARPRSALGQRESFDTLRKARTLVKTPAQFEHPQRPLNVAPGEVVDAFVKANQGLTPAGIAIDCDRRFLREVRICMTRDLQFRDCGPSAARACRTDSLLMPPVRGP